MHEHDQVVDRSSEVDPWAPGGVMSDPRGWEAAGAPSEPAGDPDVDPHEPRRHAAVARIAGVVGALAAVMAVVGVGWRAFDRGETTATSAADVPGDDEADATFDPILWTRVSADAGSLPASVSAGPDGLLRGRDDEGAMSWISVDGTLWSRDRTAGDLDAAGERWSVETLDGRHRLRFDARSGPTVVTVSEDRPLRTGTIVSWEIRAGAPSDVLHEIDGELFAQLDRREEVDWRALLGIVPSDGFRVRVVSDDGNGSFESSSGAPFGATELTARLAGDEIVVSRSGDEAGRVGALPASTDVLESLRPRVSSAWARWTGGSFIVVSTPWSSADRIEVATVGDRVVAVAKIKLDDGPRVWASDDGLEWAPVELPVEPSEGSPMPMTVGDRDVVVTISDGAATTYWSTIDAERFAPLPAVPGIDRRSQGTFGWVAADPRGSPVLRVSRDESNWTVYDLSEELGYDAARWDGSLDATAIGTKIFVISTVGDERTMLIGSWSGDG